MTDSDQGGPEPFTVRADPERLDRILRRVSEYRLVDFPDVPGWRLGTSAQHIARLRDHWLRGFDWSERETALNRFPHYRCLVDDTPIHFVHVPGAGEGKPEALVLLHGWPGSFFEFYDVLDDLLSDPAWPFDLIVPSLPGFAFSTPLKTPLGCRTIADLVDRLVTERLGFETYIAQGGDWGAVVTAWMGFDHPNSCRAIHLSSEGLRVHGAEPYQSPTAGDWTDEELRHFSRERGELQAELGYYLLQSTRPQTLGFAMHESPLGAAAWLSEKFHRWSNLDDAEDPGDHFGWDRLLTNAMLYLIPDAFVTASWIYAGHELHDPKTLPRGSRIEVPTGFSAYADPIVPAPPRSLIERAHNLVRWREMPRGGHFAAFEEPALFAEDLRGFLQAVG